MTTGSAVITPADVYKLPTQETINDLNHIHLESYLNGCHYNHMPEIAESYSNVKYNDDAKDFEVRVHKHFNFDYRRFWRLASVWLNNYPFMIIQNAGREGHDHRKRYITNANVYWQAVGYINTNVIVQPQDVDDLVEVNAQLGEELTSFYGNSLNGYFERHSYI